MIEFNILENGRISMKESIEFLKAIIDGQSSYKNIKNLILSLHNSLELLFKTVILEKNEFMIFDLRSNQNFDKLIKTYKKMRNENISLAEYASKHNDKLPNTISYKDTYIILKYLYGIDDISDQLVVQLNRLNDIRNNLMHFNMTINEDDIILCLELIIMCDDIFEDLIEGYEWLVDDSLISIIETKKGLNQLNIIELLMKDIENICILKSIEEELVITDDYTFQEIAEQYRFQRCIFDEKFFMLDPINDIQSRFKLLQISGILEIKTATVDFDDKINYLAISEEGKKLLKKMYSDISFYEICYNIRNSRSKLLSEDTVEP